MTRWTVRRIGAHPANQMTREHTLGVVDADTRREAESLILDAPGVTLYPGQTLLIQEIVEGVSPPRRLERAENANEMRMFHADGYDAFILSQGRSRLNNPAWLQRARARIKPPPVPVDHSRWLRQRTAWMLRQRYTGKVIYVIDSGVWKASTECDVAFVQWLCGPYRDGVQPFVKCVAADSSLSGWCPLRDRAYIAVAIARRVGNDRLKCIVLGCAERWYDNDAQPADEPEVPVRYNSRGRRMTYPGRA